MNNKKRISIKLLLLVPVFILGFLAIFSNAQAIINLGNVNNTAVTISDEQMKNNPYTRQHYLTSLQLIWIH